MFQTELELKERPQPNIWAVASPLVWQDAQGAIAVPVGFLTDLASIPDVLKNIPWLDVNGVSRSPAVLHDWLYRTHQFSRADSDSMLRAALLSRGASKAQAWAFYTGVRIGGGGPYASYPNGPTAADFDTQKNFEAWRLTSGHPLD